MYAAISQGESPASIGLLPGSPLVDSLKQRLVSLASNAGVIATVQKAAQSVLLNGLALLLPTAEERAKALSNLLPSGLYQIAIRVHFFHV
jgi:E3 ubiquitin-protein ligase HERC2